MNRTVQTIALATCAGLLLGILLVLAGIGRNGVRIELTGDVVEQEHGVRAAGMADGSKLRQLERQAQDAVLSLRCMLASRAPVEFELQLVSMGAESGDVPAPSRVPARRELLQQDGLIACTR